MLHGYIACDHTMLIVHSDVWGKLEILQNIHHKACVGLLTKMSMPSIFVVHEYDIECFAR